MGRQFRYTSRLKRKKLYNQRRKDRLKAVIKSLAKAAPAAPAAKPAAKGK
jgi:hypothetical protein